MVMVINTAKKMLPAMISPEVFELPSNKGVRVFVLSIKVVMPEADHDSQSRLMVRFFFHPPQIGISK